MAGFKTFVAGDVLTASDVNGYLMKQAVIQCTSGTRPTGVEGMTIYETDTDALQVYNGSSWMQIGPLGAYATWATTVSQPGAVAHTVGQARYMRVGRLVHANAALTTTAAGTANNNILVSLPVAGRTSNNPVGNGRYLDASVAEYPVFWWLYGSTTDVIGRRCDVGSAGFIGGSDPNVALANNDVLDLNLLYEADAA